MKLLLKLIPWEFLYYSVCVCGGGGGGDYEYDLVCENSKPISKPVDSLQIRKLRNLYIKTFQSSS